MSISIQCLTLNHRTAPTALRERLALGGDTLRTALREARKVPGIERIVILATCQRVELYSAPASAHNGQRVLTEWLASMGDGVPGAVAAHAEYLEGIPAARHLCRVATGLDATLLGEAQVLSQVAGARRVAVAAHAASPVLKDLFRTAVRAGERARGAVWSRYPRSDIGSVAVDEAARRLGGLSNTRAVVVGAGSAGELALRALRAHGVASLALVNRSLAHAEAVSARFMATPHELRDLPRVLRNADVVFVATAAPSHVLDTATTADALAHRPARPLVIVDAAMPRNVDPTVRTIAGVQLIDLDALTPSLARAHDERVDAIPDVEAIIEHELSTLVTRYTPASVTMQWHDMAHHTTAITP